MILAKGPLLLRDATKPGKETALVRSIELGWRIF